MLRPVMQHMAALAQAAQVAEPVVGGIAVEVRGSQHDPGGAQLDRLHQVGPAGRTAAPVTPSARCLVEPAPIRQAADLRQMRSATRLASPTGPLETDAPAQFAPVRRVEGPQFGTDGHLAPPFAGYRRGPARRASRRSRDSGSMSEILPAY